jgi:two-component system, chemotaxis family, chemotaxis protein CheY
VAEKIRGGLGNKTVDLATPTTENRPIMKERGKAAGIKVSPCER